MPSAEEGDELIGDELMKAKTLRNLIDQCIRFLPRRKKIEAAWRARNLLHTMPLGQYSYRGLHKTLLQFPGIDPLNFTLDEASLRSFLVCFMESMFTDADLRQEDIGTDVVYNKEQVSKMLGISTRTIDRYRQQGLLSSLVMRGERGQIIAFRQSDIDHLKQKYGEKLERASQFSIMTEADKEEITAKAAGRKSSGARRAEIVRQIAKETGRSIEAIRYTLLKADQNNVQS